MKFTGLIARASNGSVEIAGKDGAAVPNGIEPGSEVDITIDVVRTAAQIEEDRQDAKAARGAPPREPVRPGPAPNAPIPEDVRAAERADETRPRATPKKVPSR